LTRLSREQLKAIHARKKEILKRHAVLSRKNEILRQFSAGDVLKREHQLIDRGIPEKKVHTILKEEFDEPFTVKKTKTISQKDLIQMQRSAGVHG
jgi:hypothetical protein